MRIGGPNIALAAPPGDTTVAEALVRLQAWHASVAKAGREILASYRVSGLTVPCDVRSKHNAAVSAYLRTARDVFAQLKAKGVGATQVVIDASGKKRTLAPTSDNPFPSPVAPLAFIVSDCKGADQGLGVVPLVIPVVVSLIGAAVVSIVVVAVALGDRIRWPGGPPPPYDQQAEQYRKCLSETKDAAGCAGLLPPKRFDWVQLGLVAAMLTTVGVGGFLLYRRLS